MISGFEHQTLGDIVSDNYQAATIFERYGLDFCCGGRSSLAEACRHRRVDLNAVVTEIQGLAAAGSDEVSFDDTLGLIAHIVERHHAYVRTALPSIQAHLEKVVRAHGDRHPELHTIAGLFQAVSQELSSHMLKEEQVLFPYIRALAEAVLRGGPPPPDMFGSVQNPIRMMESEHQQVGGELANIRALSSGYEPPEDACTTYRLVYEELRAFEHDLHRHVHLENNVLFPQAMKLEAVTTARGD